MNRTLLASAVLVILMAATPTVQAGENSFGEGISAQTAYAYVDTGWTTFSATYDCVDGWGDDTWQLTLTSARDLTVRVLDCCIAGDYYEMYIDDCCIGTTPVVAIGGTTFSDGSATVSLAAGTYLIKVRNALADFGSLTGCPAGFTVWGTLADPTGLYPMPCGIEPDIDIKPGSCPNPFNGKSQGKVPVAIVGSASLDVSIIDPTTICLTGPGGSACALAEYEIKDSTQPGDYDPADCQDCFDADDPANFNCDLWDATVTPPVPGTDGVLDSYCGDGYLDLVVKFDTQELAAAIGPADRDACVELLLAGETFGDVPIAGSDSVVIKTKIK